MLYGGGQGFQMRQTWSDSCAAKADAADACPGRHAEFFQCGLVMYTDTLSERQRSSTTTVLQCYFLSMREVQKVKPLRWLLF
jgi:hypothetical protein